MTKKDIKLINGTGAGASTPHVNQHHLNRYTDLEISDMRIRYNEIINERLQLYNQKEALIQSSLQYREFSVRRCELNELIENIKVEIVSCNFALRLLHDRITSHRPQMTEFDEEGGGIKDIITGTGSGASSLPEQKTFTNREIVDMQMSLIVLQEDLIKVTSDIREINLIINEKQLPQNKRKEMKSSLKKLTNKKDDIEEEIMQLENHIKSEPIKEGKGLKSSKWIDHVKAHSKTHNISYKQALKAAKETYKNKL
jgi:hypothetical protein